MLPKRNSNTISTESGTFRYVVSESKIDDSQIALTINIQSEENGAVLRVTGLTTSRVPVMESKFYMGRTVLKSILPRHVGTLISRGIENGWQPSKAGPPFCMNVTNAEVYDPST